MVGSIAFSQFRIAYDVNQEVEATGGGNSITADVEEGISLSYDYMFTDMFGAGGEYQLERDDEFAIHSVYGIANYNITDAINGFARVGLDIPNESDIDGGVCWSIGAGYSFSEKFGANVLYSWYDIDVGEGVDMTYTRISIGATITLW